MVLVQSGHTDEAPYTKLNEPVQDVILFQYKLQHAASRLSCTEHSLLQDWDLALLTLRLMTLQAVVTAVL